MTITVLNMEVEGVRMIKINTNNHGHHQKRYEEE